MPYARIRHDGRSDHAGKRVLTEARGRAPARPRCRSLKNVRFREKQRQAKGNPSSLATFIPEKNIGDEVKYCALLAGSSGAAGFSRLLRRRTVPLRQQPRDWRLLYFRPVLLYQRRVCPPPLFFEFPVSLILKERRAASRAHSRHRPPSRHAGASRRRRRAPEATR